MFKKRLLSARGKEPLEELLAQVVHLAQKQGVIFGRISASGGEQKFGEAKAWHGLGRRRYLGLARYRLQAYLTALVLNAKRLVKLLYGLGFRQPPRRVLQAA